MAADLHAIAAALVLYDEQRDPERVAIAGMPGVAVTQRLQTDDARRVERLFRVALTVGLVAVDLGLARAIATRLVTREELPGGRVTIGIAGLPLVGREEPHLAAERALAMRAKVVAELERALDQQPETRRNERT